MNGRRSSNMPRLHATQWRQRVESYREAVVEKQEADRTSRRAGSTAADLRKEIIDAMGGSPVAVCANYMLMHTQTPGVAATVSCRDGRELNLEDVAEIILRDGQRIAAADITKIYGGRTGYHSLHIEEGESE